MRLSDGLMALCAPVMALAAFAPAARADYPVPFHTVETSRGPIADNPDADECYDYVSITTGEGTIILELHHCAAPVTVENFLQYVDDGFYDDTLIHRVERGFVIQGGGYDLNMNEKPGRPPIKNEWPNGLKNEKGTIAMARGDDPNSATSQFFINLRSSPNLDTQAKGGAGFCVFGRVVEGMDVVDQISVVDTIRKPDLGNIQSPMAPVQIIQAGRILGDEAKQLADKHRESRSAMARAGFTKRSEIFWKSDNRAKNAKMTEEERVAQGIEYVKAQGWDVTKGVRLPSGVWYIDDVEGVGTPPRPDDWVAMKWDGWLTWGEKFGSWEDFKGPIKGPVNGFVPGYQEAIMTMKPRGVRVIVIPAHLAYGEMGREPKIPANAALVYRVELLEVLPGATPVPIPETPKTPADEAKQQNKGDGAPAPR